MLFVQNKHAVHVFRYDVLDQVPSGEELRMCLLVKTSLGRIRRWRKEQQCQVYNQEVEEGAAVPDI